jgi:hypothetical protein
MGVFLFFHVDGRGMVIASGWTDSDAIEAVKSRLGVGWKLSNQLHGLTWTMSTPCVIAQHIHY